MSKEQNKSGSLIAEATKTPRTQAAIKTYGDYIRSEDAVSIEFAEQLETELAEARAEIERLKEAVKTVQSAFKNYKNLFNQLLKTIKTLIQKRPK